MGALVLVVVLVALSVGICVLAVRIGRHPDRSFLELVHLYRLFGLPNPGLVADLPRLQLRANRDELNNIASYSYQTRQRA